MPTSVHTRFIHSTWRTHSTSYLFVDLYPIFQELVDEGYAITPEIIANFSPYRTEHLNRFGSYDVRFDQKPPLIIERLRLSPDLAVRAN